MTVFIFASVYIISIYNNENVSVKNWTARTAINVLWLICNWSNCQIIVFIYPVDRMWSWCTRSMYIWLYYNLCRRCRVHFIYFCGCSLIFLPPCLSLGLSFLSLSVFASKALWQLFFLSLSYVDPVFLRLFCPCMAYTSYWWNIFSMS